MSETILKLQKNIFAITVVTAGVLGVSLAYFGAVGLRLFFNTNTKQITANAAGPSRAAAPQRAYRGVDEFTSIVTGNFVRDSGSQPEEAASAAAAVQAAGEIELMGVLYATPARYARALIKEKDAKNPESYGIGKTVAGHRVVWIHTNAITVDVGGNRFKIKVGEKSGEAASTPPPAATASAGGGQQITLKRDRLQQLMKKPDEIYKNKFQPAIVNGKIAGWKLLLVPQDNFLYQLGARSGDILRRFNGEPLESQEKMIQMWQSLQSSNKITVDIERGGKIFTYDILIQ